VLSWAGEEVLLDRKDGDIAKKGTRSLKLQGKSTKNISANDLTWEYEMIVFASSGAVAGACSDDERTRLDFGIHAGSLPMEQAA